MPLEFCVRFVFVFLVIGHCGSYTSVKAKPSVVERWLIFLEDTGERMISAVMDGDTVRACYISADSHLTSSMMERIGNATNVPKCLMDQLIDNCTHLEFSLKREDGMHMIQEYGILSALFIYPGTKWCGAGDIADSYDDLGPEVEADSCCRDHDHCNDSIEAGGTAHGLSNDSPITMSNCDCDDQFRQCLQKANTKTANRIGRIYFNVLKISCFRKDCPVTGCKKKQGLLRPTCQEYEFDCDCEPEWQVFDAKRYIPNSDDDDDEDDSSNEIEGKSHNIFEYLLDVFDSDKRKK